MLFIYFFKVCGRVYACNKIHVHVYLVPDYRVRGLQGSMLQQQTFSDFIQLFFFFFTCIFLRAMFFTL